MADLSDSIRKSNEQALEWVSSFHKDILEATKSYVSAVATASEEAPEWPVAELPTAPDLKDLIKDSFDFQARMLEENKTFSLALVDAWAETGLSLVADAPAKGAKSAKSAKSA